MDPQRLTQLLQQPASVNAADLHDLTVLVNEYPYFQAARVLLAKATIDNAAELRTAAVYTTDRSVLQKIIDGRFGPSLNIDEQLEVLAQDADHIDAFDMLNTPQEPAENSEPNATQLPDTEEGVVEEMYRSPQEEAEAYAEELLSPEATGADVSLDVGLGQHELEESDGESALDFDTVVEHEQEGNAHIFSANATAEEDTTEEVMRNLEEYRRNRSKYQELEEREQHKRQLEERQEEERRQQAIAEQQAAADQLAREQALQQQTEQRQSVQKAEAETEQAAQAATSGDIESSFPYDYTAFQLPDSYQEPDYSLSDLPDPELFDLRSSLPDQPLVSNHDSTQQLDPEQLEKERLRQGDLIENFITVEPQLAPKPEGASTADDLAKTRAKDIRIGATENLARIMAKQGKVEQAIQIYEQLSLKYPEKSAYFAGLISDLRQ